jgi:hypothetical protein
MAYEIVRRNRYHIPEPLQTGNHTSKNHYEDLHDFHIPLERMHNSNLHDYGIARGLEVNGTIGGTEIIVNPGVAIDISGQLISLSNTGSGDTGENPLTGDSREVPVPVHLSTVGHAGKTVYVTIEFSEILRPNEGSLGRLEQVPWVRLQPVKPDDSLGDRSIVLAIAVINAQGKLSELKDADSSTRHRRYLIGQTIEELQIQRSSKVGDKVQEKLSGKIGPGEKGGLRITVPDTQDSILFARENGSNFASLEINANVGIGTSSPSEKLEVNGTVKASKFVGDGSELTKAGQWTDVEDGISYNAGNVGIGTINSLSNLQVSGSIVLNSIQRPETRLPLPAGATMIWNDGGWLRINQNYDWSAPVQGVHVPNLFACSSLNINAGGWGNPGTGNVWISGKVGIGTTDMKRPLHVEGSEIHSGGSAAGFSFANRSTGSFVDSPSRGERWVWYSLSPSIITGHGDHISDLRGPIGPIEFISRPGIARLWSGRDVLSIDTNGTVSAARFTPTSDARLKTNIMPLTDVMDKLGKIRGVSFKWNELDPYGRSESEREIGLIAQEVEEVFPELITTWGDEGYRGIDYNRFTGVLLEAIKELKAENEVFKEEIKVLKEAISRDANA